MEVFATKTETNNEQQQPASVLAAAAALVHSPTSITKPTDAFNAQQQQHQHQHQQSPALQQQQQQQHDAATSVAAVVALAQTPEQSLASTKEKSTPEKVSTTRNTNECIVIRICGPLRFSVRVYTLFVQQGKG